MISTSEHAPVKRDLCAQREGEGRFLRFPERSLMHTGAREPVHVILNWNLSQKWTAVMNELHI